MPLTSARSLRRSGILGMNRRNIDYIGRFNERSLYPLVDDKLKTKKLAEKHRLATPRLRAVLDTQHDLKDLAGRISGLGGFAIKPAKGAGGKGILVITQCNGDNFVKSSSANFTLGDLTRHCSNILAGLHSLSGVPDVALVEDLIEPEPFFHNLSVQGVPDIRVIIFRGVPVMAMLRLATHASDGKANLHQGAIGVGLDLASGACAHAVQFSRRIHVHPDTGATLDRIQIPEWRQLLTLAARCHELTGLGYLGADLVVDRQRGPLMLELNARPGLAIQVANGAGLLPRLKAIEALDDIPMEAESRVELAMELLSHGSA